MKDKPINIFIIDDEFPRPIDFRERGVYNSPISMEDLYHLAVHSEWEHHLGYLQQLIKDLYVHEVRINGYINIVGFSTPTQAIKEIQSDGGMVPEVIIYDWEYPNAPAYSTNASNWLMEILHSVSEAFVFVYSNLVHNKEANISGTVNRTELNKYADRLQLFSKGGSIKSSFTSEEFILQYIVCKATDRGKIKINGIEVEFTRNSYLKNASDILFLQKILGNEYVLDELGKINFRIDELGVEKILNDSEGYVLFSESKGVLVNPKGFTEDKELGLLVKLSYSEVIKKFTSEVLEDVLERGFFVL